MQSVETAWFRLDLPDAAADGGAGGLRLALRGRWCLAELARIEAAWPASWPIVHGDSHGDRQPWTIDGTDLEHLDTAGALMLLRRLPPGVQVAWAGVGATPSRVLEQVQQAVGRAHPISVRSGPGHRLRWPVAGPLVAVFERLGRRAAGSAALLLGHLQFLGWVMLAVAAAARRPARLRWRELAVQVEQTGLGAIPVAVLVTSLIGVVLAYLLGLQAEQYGASIFVVDGVAIGVTREFAPIIVAVVVSGRSGAAFTAQLGAMQLAEETDAIRTLGLDVAQVLVVPRVLALVLVLPLLVFVGDIAALAGAMLVTAAMLDIGPGAFIARLHDSLELLHVLVGLAKAPVFALVVAVIGTRMGMTVGRDTRAVGAATTSTVVQSIVAVILIDAAFAVLLQALGW